MSTGTRIPASDPYVEAAAEGLWNLEHGDGFMSWREIASADSPDCWPREAELYRRRARAALAATVNAEGGPGFIDCDTGHLMPSGLRLPCPYCIKAAWFAVNDLATMLEMATAQEYESGGI